MNPYGQLTHTNPNITKKNYFGPFELKSKEICRKIRFIEKFSDNKIGNNCKNKDCLTCNDIEFDNIIKSNSTSYYTSTNLYNYSNCNTKYIVYCLTCKLCGMQYVGETSTTLKCRITSHKSSIKCNKHGYLYDHFRSHNLTIYNKNIFSVNILDDDNDNKCHNIRTDKELYWIKLLNTGYPFGLNDKIKHFGLISKNYNKNQTYNPFFTLKITPPKKNRGRRTKSKLKENYIKYNPDSWYDACIKLTPKDLLTLIKSLNKKTKHFLYINLKSICNHTTPFLNIIPFKSYDKTINKKNSCFNNIIDFKFPYISKEIEKINIKKIIKDNLIINLNKPIPPFKINYKYNPNLGNIFYNYNNFKIKNIKCNCNLINFNKDKINIDGVDHIVTGDLDCLNKTFPNICKIMKLGTKFRPTLLPDNKLISEWSTLLLNQFNKFDKNFDFESISINIIKQILIKINLNINFDSLPYKEIDHIKSKFIITCLDKATNNFAIICPILYFSKLNSEMGIDNNALQGNLTYIPQVNLNKKNIIYKHNDIINLIKLVNLTNPNIPKIYGIPKMHKNPIKFRFITGAYNSSIKPLSIMVHKILIFIQNHFHNYCSTIERYNNKNVYWSIKNIDNLNFCKFNDDYSLYIADFTSLFTNLPHNITINAIHNLLDICFKNSKKRYIKVGFKNTWYTNENSKDCFDINIIKFMIGYILNNSYTYYNNIIFKQENGIPQGYNCSPLIADLTLSYYEYIYLNSTSFKLNGFRYMDDILIIHKNTINIESILQNIYPKELTLEKTNHNNKEGSFLDIMLYFKNNKLEYKLYNKIDTYTFKVNRLTHYNSNCSFAIKHGSIIGEILRIFKRNSLVENIVLDVKSLYTHLSKFNHYPKIILIVLLKNLIKKNYYIQNKLYNIDTNHFIKSINKFQ